MRASKRRRMRLSKSNAEKPSVLVQTRANAWWFTKYLTVSSVTLQDNQREAIFHTKYTIGEKVCSLIIDGGSCANVASQVLVDKLQLPTTSHPHPYVVEWLNQSKRLQVSRRAFLSFSIGKSYKEKLWCDVIPMDVCHLLLGRSWLFDMRVIYDGYANTYSFNKDGHKITLIPNPKSKSKKPHPSLTIINANMSFTTKKIICKTLDNSRSCKTQYHTHWIKFEDKLRRNRRECWCHTLMQQTFF